MPDYSALEHDTRTDSGKKPAGASAPPRAAKPIATIVHNDQATIRREDMRAERERRDAANRVPPQVRYRIVEPIVAADGEDWMRADNDALWQEDDRRD
jgi:hypothetical protein